MKKIFLLSLFLFCLISAAVFAAPPDGNQTPPIIPDSTEPDMNPPVLPDNSGQGSGQQTQTTNTCNQLPPGSDEYDQCMNGAYSLPGMPGGGTQPTGVYNGTGGTYSSAGAGSPQSGSPQLASCSNIRFLSLLDILIWIKCIIVIGIIPLIFAAAFVVFLWGVLKFMAARDAPKQAEAKQLIIAGLIGLFVMTSVWGILKIVSTTFGIDASTVPVLQTSSLKKTP